MEYQNPAYLAEEKLGRLMRGYAVPCVVSLLVGALYNIVDQIFIANADYLGSYGNAANTVVFPLTVIALAVAVMIGDGCCAFVSLSLGRGNARDAGRSMGNAVLLTVLSGVLLAAVYLLFDEPLIALFGGRVNEETYAYAQEYFFWIALGVPFYMFGQAMNPIIRADGSPRFAMASTLAGAVVNLVLDPIFIFVFRAGMTGAAVATVIGQLVTAAAAVWYLRRMKSAALSRSCFRLNPKIIGRTLSLGICSFLSQVSLVAAMAAINNMLRKYGAADAVFGQALYAQIPMAVVGIVMKVFQIVISIVIGMAAGCIPIVGFNMGAGRRDRVRKLFTRLLWAEAVVGLAALAVAELLPGQRDFRREERERILYGIRRKSLSRLPLHAAAGLREQGRVHLFAGDGEGGRLDAAVDGARNRVRRRVCGAAAGLFRAGRRALLDARVGCADGAPLGAAHCDDV